MNKQARNAIRGSNLDGTQVEVKVSALRTGQRGSKGVVHGSGILAVYFHGGMRFNAYLWPKKGKSEIAAGGGGCTQEDKFLSSRDAFLRSFSINDEMFVESSLIRVRCGKPAGNKRNGYLQLCDCR